MPTPTRPRRGSTPEATPPSGVSRRSFMQTMGLSAAATSLQAAGNARADSITRPDVDIAGPDPIEITLKVNGSAMPVTIDPATTLLETLRVHLGLTGAKEVCDRGACGACSVLMDGKLVTSCMMLAADAVGTEVTTVEGLARGGTLDPVQEAFVRHDGLQCGFCTPGFIMASRALLNEYPKPTMYQIKKYLSGNICRCGCYTNIFNAVLAASGQEPITDSKEA